MSYKEVVGKNGKVYGHDIYKNYQDEDGNVKENNFFISGFFVAVVLSFVFLPSMGYATDFYLNEGDVFVDYVEWAVPHLSTQIYELIYIVKAEHLDENRSFVADVYDSVKERDDNWTFVGDGEYLRVTFERELDSSKDITIFARGMAGGGLPVAGVGVEVFAVDENESVVNFDNVSEEGWYKVYLVNLSGVEDVFDLRVFCNGNQGNESNVSCGVWFDYVVDPSVINVTTSSVQYDSGETISFTGYWNESLTEVKLLIDDDTTFLNCSYGDTSGCIASSSNTSSSPVVASMIANKSGKWYARVCNADNCSSRNVTYNWTMDEDLSGVSASFWGEDASDRSGYSVSSAGDVNGDGYDDLLIGAHYDENGGAVAGQTYLILGKPTGWAMDINLSNSNASFWGEDAIDYSGYSVSSAGDVNGDGYDDLLIGAPYDEDGGRRRRPNLSNLRKTNRLGYGY